MGKNTICEDILEGPWRLRPGITRVVIPISELLTTGVCHIEIPLELYPIYCTGGRVARWLDNVRDGDRLELSGDHDWIRPEFIEVAAPALQRVDWEWNNWHYDQPPVNASAGLTDESNYDIKSAVGPKERANRKEQTFLVTLPFPTDFQGPTVAVPWAGEYEGKAVQAPIGYATVFDMHACWHRGDRWLGSRRGVLSQRSRIVISDGAS